MTITETYIGLYESLLRSGLNGDGFAPHREEARRLLSLSGIPSHDDENYKYSDFTKKLDDKYQFSLSPEKIQVDLNHFWQCQVPQMDTKVILLSNGWYYEKNDVDQGMPEGIIVCGLREASEKYPQLFRQYYNRYTPGADGFTHLNTMFANDGVFVYVPDGLHVDKTIQLVNLTHGFTNRFVMQRNLIAVGLPQDYDLRSYPQQNAEHGKQCYRIVYRRKCFARNVFHTERARSVGGNQKFVLSSGSRKPSHQPGFFASRRYAAQ